MIIKAKQMLCEKRVRESLDIFKTGKFSYH